MNSTPREHAEPVTWRWALTLVLVVVGFGIYANSLHAPFVFDDKITLLESPNIRRLWPLSECLTGPAGSTTSGRPLPALSFALNYAVGGLDVFGYHVVNVGLHVLTAIALMGLVRVTLAEFLGARGRLEALGPAFLVALLWLTHPLHTDALNHVSYRTETMAALFYILTLSCAARALSAPRPRGYQVAAVVCAFAGVASKEFAVSAPLLVLLYDRQFVSGTFRDALRQRRGFYAALFSSWLLLGFLVATADRGESVSFEIEQVTPLDYLRTQARGLWLYLRLAVWPRPLVFDYYGLEVARSWSEVWLEAAGIALLFVWTLVGVARRKAWSVAALAVFAILAPTSSFIPLAGEILAEHRMVLPLAPLAILLVVGVARHLPNARYATPLALGLAAVFGALTVERNADYATVEGLWRDTVAKRPNNPRALNNLFDPLIARGATEEAEEILRRSLELRPNSVHAWNNLGMLMAAKSQWEEAEAALDRSLELKPDHVNTLYNYGQYCAQRGRWPEAAAYYERTVELEPDHGRGYIGLGQALLRTGRRARAAEALREALRLEPQSWISVRTLAWILATSRDDALRDGAEALRLANALCSSSPRPKPRQQEVLAAALAEVGRYEEAVQVSEEAARAAERAGEGRLARAIRARAALYAQGRPFRE